MVNEPVLGMKKRPGYKGLKGSTARDRKPTVKAPENQQLHPRAQGNAGHKDTAERIIPGQFLPTWLFKNRKGRGVEGKQKKLNWSPLKRMRPPSIFCSNFIHKAQGQSVPTLRGTSGDHCISLINYLINQLYEIPTQSVLYNWRSDR